MAVTNLKQLTYRVSGTFKFNKSNFIIATTTTGKRRSRSVVDGRAGGRTRARKMNSPVYFFITLDDCRAFYVRPAAAAAAPPLYPAFVFIFIFPVSPQPPSHRRQRSLNNRAAPPGTGIAPRARGEQYPKITPGFVFISFFVFPRARDGLLNNSACTLEVGSRCETVTAL